MVVEEFGDKTAVEDLREDDFQRLMLTQLARFVPSTKAVYVGLIRALFNFAYNDEQQLISKFPFFSASTFAK